MAEPINNLETIGTNLSYKVCFLCTNIENQWTNSKSVARTLAGKLAAAALGDTLVMKSLSWSVQITNNTRVHIPPAIMQHKAY